MSITLSYLDKGYNWNNANDIQHVVNDLTVNESEVSTLILSGNTLALEAAEHITESLSRQKNIEKLLLGGLFTARKKDEVAASLKALSLGFMRSEIKLVELDLSNNAFGPIGIMGVTNLISSQCCYTLKVLNMNHQGLGHGGCRALVNAMVTARNDSNKEGLNLEVFIAGRNRLENEGMEMLCEVFGDGMNSLKELNLLQNGIGLHGTSGVESLIVSIRNHKDLRILNISDNNIELNSMELLYDVLSDFKSLEQLHMDDCLLHSKGSKLIQLIAEDKSFCPDLKVISLRGNEIRSSLSVSLVRALLEGKPKIEKIDLQDNDLKKTDLVEIRNLLISHEKDVIFVEQCDVSDLEDEEDTSEECEDEYSDESGDSEDESEDSRGDCVHRQEHDEKSVDLKEHKSDDPADELVSIPIKLENQYKTKVSPFNTTLNGSKATFSDSNNLVVTSSGPESVVKHDNIFSKFANNSPELSGINSTNLFQTSVTSTRPFSFMSTGLFSNSAFGLATTNTSDLFSIPTTSSEPSEIEPINLFQTHVTLPERIPIINFGLISTQMTSLGPSGMKEQSGISISSVAFQENQSGLFSTAPISCTTLSKPSALSSYTTSLCQTSLNASNIFSSLSNSTKETLVKSTKLFSSNLETKDTCASLFPKPSVTLTKFNTFTNVQCPATIDSYQTAFSLNSEGTNHFSISPIKNVVKQSVQSFQSNVVETKNLSFCDEVKSEISLEKFKLNIMTSLKSNYVMEIDEKSLKMFSKMDCNIVLDTDLQHQMENCPENGIRVSLILCDDVNTFNLGFAIITFLLKSSKSRLRSTNALLVEMDCIKSEEKRFVPFCFVNPILLMEVLKQLLRKEALTDDVRTTLKTVLKNFLKFKTLEVEDLLKELEGSMKQLSL